MAKSKNFLLLAIYDSKIWLNSSKSELKRFRSVTNQLESILTRLWRWILLSWNPRCYVVCRSTSEVDGFHWWRMLMQDYFMLINQVFRSQSLKVFVRSAFHMEMYGQSKSFLSVQCQVWFEKCDWSVLPMRHWL